MTNNPAVSVIIPARNEAAHVANTISSVESLAQQVIVVDDGSWDNTADIARGLGAEVIRRNADPGKGQSLACGLARARGDIIVFLDADLGSSGGEVKKLIAMITAGKADLVVARIEQVGTPGWGVISKTSQRLLTHLGVTVTQPLCGQRALSRLAVEKIQPLARGWGVEVAMLVKAARHQLVVEEVPTDMYHQGTGRSYRGTMHRARQGLEIAATLGRLTLNPWK